MEFHKICEGRVLVFHEHALMGDVERMGDGRWRVRYFSGVDCRIVDRFFQSFCAAKQFCKEVLSGRYVVEELPTRAISDVVGSVVVVARLMDGVEPHYERWATPKAMRDYLAKTWEFARVIQVSSDYTVFVEAAVVPNPSTMNDVRLAWRDVAEFIECHWDIPMTLYKIDDCADDLLAHRLDRGAEGAVARAESDIYPMFWGSVVRAGKGSDGVAAVE